MKNKIAEKLKVWYQQNKRQLPWRQTKDPYKIWLSEIILQQTRVEQGMSYYLKFIERFPTIYNLANAKEDDVLKLWQGLGYYSRARNLHAAAKQILRNKGVFPSSYSELIKLKGVGPYTAAAISSICFNETRAVVDGNVFRFIARMYGINTPIDSTEGKKEFQQLADELLDKKNAGEHNQSIMEFGSLHCKPAQPLCVDCTFEEICFARRKNSINKFPVKTNKVKTKTRHFHYFVIVQNSKTFLKKRLNKKDIWQNLFEFPLIETSESNEEEKILKELHVFLGVSKNAYSIKKISIEYKHVLSHQLLRAKFYEVELNKPSENLKNNFLLVKKSNVNKFALPRLIDKYWNGK